MLKLSPETNIVIADRKDQFHVLIPLEKPGVVHVRQIIDRIVEVKVAVVVPVHEAAHVERAAHRDAG